MIKLTQNNGFRYEIAWQRRRGRGFPERLIELRAVGFSYARTGGGIFFYYLSLHFGHSRGNLFYELQLAYCRDMDAEDRDRSKESGISALPAGSDEDRLERDGSTRGLALVCGQRLLPCPQR